MRTYPKFLYVSLLLILVGAVSLNISQAGGAMANTVTVTEKDNNKTVELNKGNLLAVVLEFSPGTGYSWQIAENDPKLLDPQGEPAISGGSEQKSMPGSSEQATFLFKALKSGTTVIVLHHKRIWEKGKEPLKVFSVTVKIK